MRILLTGATGLVGQGVLRECLQADDVVAVVALGRRPSGLSHPKLSELICSDFGDLGSVEPRLHPFDACLYCAGAVPVGMSEPAYRHVTRDLTVHVADVLARSNPRLTFVYVSGAFSDPWSHLMPLRVKGETEHALAALPLRAVMFRTGGVQPVDDVRSPHRGMDRMYRIAGPLMGLGVRLVPAAFTTSARVGRAMLAVLRDGDPPAILENRDINRLAAE